MTEKSRPPLSPSASESFWEGHYVRMTSRSSGRPSSLLVRFAQERSLGRALELGCSRGDDAIWLAQQGWQVLGVDVAPSALRAARDQAHTADLRARLKFERHDLALTFPGGAFELVCALYLESPVDFPRAKVLQRAADAVAPGGLLLSVTHGSAAPWSWGDPNRAFPTAEDELRALELDASAWSKVFVGSSSRLAKGPGGQTAEVIDTVVAIERKSSLSK